ncbi:beta-N-acetylglucosaminidase domain-containing protein [Marinimicrobium alkaliphilum]|uniref:beta-N-acetylglucosaminidase domain-containing protein n=1 Tax=Marinimicrobium alkaliphilum TaxID=2202654 RepID=UPI000DBA9AD1|nr:beta-N-acetylglucosaminidase domain-containing protein [Marinimicrobium alkaliphilum]
MTAKPPIRPGSLGIIEGFFGRCWSWNERRDMARFSAHSGLGFYLYAPKSDSRLRRLWRQPWNDADLRALLELRRECQSLGLAFGVGLSPLELYREPGADACRALAEKVRYLNRLEPDCLCLLFDDMRGDLPALATNQIDLAHCAAEHSVAEQLILCPTYYSDDPVLEKVFGTRPAHYWETLGERLDSHIGIFWTGPTVCSDRYPAEHLLEVGARLKRQPILWDNYPVNDSSVKSQLLQLRGVDRSHGHLPALVGGHAINPMNQPYLSRIPLLSASEAYRLGDAYSPEHAFESACRALAEEPLATALIEDTPLFQDRGLGALTQAEQTRLRQRYQQWADDPMAREVVAWLNGEYAFDPACLTD